MKTLLTTTFAAFVLLISSCGTTSPCYSVSQGKGAPTPISKGKDYAWNVKMSKTPYYVKPKKQRHKRYHNPYVTKWYEKWL